MYRGRKHQVEMWRKKPRHACLVLLLTRPTFWLFFFLLFDGWHDNMDIKVASPWRHHHPVKKGFSFACGRYKHTQRKIERHTQKRLSSIDGDGRGEEKVGGVFSQFTPMASHSPNRGAANSTPKKKGGRKKKRNKKRSLPTPNDDDDAPGLLMRRRGNKKVTRVPHLPFHEIWWSSSCY